MRERLKLVHGEFLIDSQPQGVPEYTLACLSAQKAMLAQLGKEEQN
jgi:hypothetical protein